MAQMSRTRGEQTATVTLEQGVNNFHAVLLRTNGSADASLTIYDNTSATGTVVFDATVAGAVDQQLFSFDLPVRVEEGLHCVLSGTGASFFVYTV